MHTIKQWAVAGLVAGAACLGGRMAHASPEFTAPQITSARLFRMPPPDAIGAAAGGIIAINAAVWIRKRRDAAKAKR